MKLGDYAQGRDNNFNLIRIIAALAVLVTHSFVLTSGSDEMEPLRKGYGLTIGSIAVDVFFITSGFLVTSSLLNRKSVIEFIWARALRILPALWLMLAITAIAFGSLLTSLPPIDYFTNVGLYKYLAKCSTLLSGMSYDLPGLFENNPYKFAVNGSLWTLPLEVKMYGMLALIWVVLKKFSKNNSHYFGYVIVCIYAVSGLLITSVYYFKFLMGTLPQNFEAHKSWTFYSLLFMFFSGSAFYIFKDKITLTKSIFFPLLAFLFISLLNKHILFFVYTMGLSYIVFYLAYVPSGFIRWYNKLGDYSYGVYIYAFFIQQAIASQIHSIQVVDMIALSMILTLMMSIFSWHVLEKRALTFKSTFVFHTLSLINLRKYWRKK